MLMALLDTYTLNQTKVSNYYYKFVEYLSLVFLDEWTHSFVYVFIAISIICGLILILFIRFSKHMRKKELLLDSCSILLIIYYGVISQPIYLFMLDEFRCEQSTSKSDCWKNQYLPPMILVIIALISNFLIVLFVDLFMLFKHSLDGILIDNRTVLESLIKHAIRITSAAFYQFYTNRKGYEHIGIIGVSLLAIILKCIQPYPTNYVSLTLIDLFTYLLWIMTSLYIPASMISNTSEYMPIISIGVVILFTFTLHCMLEEKTKNWMDKYPFKFEDDSNKIFTNVTWTVHMISNISESFNAAHIGSYLISHAKSCEIKDCACLELFQSNWQQEFVEETIVGDHTRLVMH